MKTIKAFVGVLAHPTVAKVVLALVFICSTRFCNKVTTEFLGTPINQEGTTLSTEEIYVAFEVIRIKDGEFQARIKANPSAYTSKDYFEEMVEIDKLKYELGIGPVSGSMFEGFRTRHLPERARLAVENEISKIKSRLPFEGRGALMDIRASGWARFNHARETIWDPYEREKRYGPLPTVPEIAEEKGWGYIIRGVASFLTSAYLGCFPFAFVLFLIWMRESARSSKSVWDSGFEDDEYRKRLRSRLGNVGSFTISLVLYPFIIGSVWRKNLADIRDGYGVQAEIRRTKEKLFTLLSDDELAAAKRWAKAGLSRLEIRRRLEASGRRARHSYASAFVATLVMAMVGGLIVPLASAKSSVASMTVQVSATAQVDARAGPTTDTGSQHQELQAVLTIVPVLEEPAMVEKVPPQHRGVPHRGHPREIEHVPLTLASRFGFTFLP